MGFGKQLPSLSSASKNAESRTFEPWLYDSDNLNGYIMHLEIRHRSKDIWFCATLGQSKILPMPIGWGLHPESSMAWIHIYHICFCFNQLRSEMKYENTCASIQGKSYSPWSASSSLQPTYFGALRCGCVLTLDQRYPSLAGWIRTVAVWWKKLLHVSARILVRTGC